MLGTLVAYAAQIKEILDECESKVNQIHSCIICSFVNACNWKDNKTDTEQHFT